MHKTILKKKLSCLKPVELKAYNYLKKEGIIIDLNKSKLLYGKPDFVDIKGNRYEIKRIRAEKKGDLFLLQKIKLIILKMKI